MRRNGDFVLKKVGDDSLLVPLGPQVKERNGLVTLNGTAAFLWELLASDRSLQDLTNAVVERFDVDRSRADTDVRSFIGWMTEAGVLEP
jgi:hypothetical protein